MKTDLSSTSSNEIATNEGTRRGNPVPVRHKIAIALVGVVLLLGLFVEYLPKEVQTYFKASVGDVTSP